MLKDIDPTMQIDHPGLGASGPTTTVIAFPLDRIHPAPWNPRKHFDEEQLVSLAQDIAAQGILQALVLRPHPNGEHGHHEIVCGERRYRAALRAGLVEVPATVRELDDRAAMECALSENGQRENLHPIEEADGFLALHTVHGESAEDIAARFGVSVKLVHGRLALARLCDEGRRAFLDGKLSWGVALRIARLSTLDYQREAVEQLVTKREHWRPPLSIEEAGRWIENRYHLRLASAPFDTADATLMPEVGACLTCPKTTDAQRALFGDVGEPAQCTDPVCFARKKESAWQRVAAPVANGRTVLTAEASAAITSLHTSEIRGGYARTDDKPREHGGRKTWQQLLGVHAPTPVIARDGDGNPVELYEPSALKEAMKKAGLKKLTKVGGSEKGGAKSSSKSSAAQSYEERETERQAIERALVVAFGEAFHKRPVLPDDRGWWQALTKAVLLVDPMQLEELARYLKLDLEKKRKGVSEHSKWQKIGAALTEEIDVRSPAGCRELLVLGMLSLAATASGELAENAKPLFAFYKLDVEALAKKALADLHDGPPG